MLNGPPGSGKSTLSARFAAAHPLTLNLDVDVIRGLLGGWLDEPVQAGLLARRVSIEMARVVLSEDRDVIVAQFLARSEFLVELEKLATDTGADFIEVALMVSRDDMKAWFAERSADPTTVAHEDAALLIDRLGGDDALDEMYEGFVRLVASRPATRQIRPPSRRHRRSTS